MARVAARSVMAMQQKILEELSRDPAVDASRIFVSMHGHQVLLRGAVRSYSERCRAEAVAQTVSGLRVRNEIEVRLSIGNYRSDAGLMHLTNEVLENYVVLSDEPPHAAVHDGWVTLRGSVTSDFRKKTAEAVVRELAGVRGITNEIQVR